MLWVVDSKRELELRYHSIIPEVSYYKQNRQWEVIRAEISIGEIKKLLKMGALWKRQENRGPEG